MAGCRRRHSTSHQTALLGNIWPRLEMLVGNGNRELGRLPPGLGGIIERER